MRIIKARHILDIFDLDIGDIMLDTDGRFIKIVNIEKKSGSIVFTDEDVLATRKEWFLILKYLYGY